MKIGFYGGVETVTGSNFVLEEDNEKIVVDCGLIQKERTCDLENFAPFPYDPKEISAIFITHAHLDHIGRLPKIIKNGFKGYIYSTLPTKELAYEILKDAIKVIEENCREYNKEVFYEERDIEITMKRWETVNYYEPIETKNFKITFYNAGHILGSSFLLINEKSSNKKIVFSGDLGNKFKSLDKKLDELPAVDYLVLESTYGDRDHENLEKRREILERIVERTIKEKRVLIIPTFALERSQEIIYDLQELIENKKIPEIKIFLDSPLALRISKIYEKYPEYLNEEAKREILTKGIFKRPYLEIIESKEDEKKIFDYPNPKIILAGSGMVTGGRIIDILKRYIENEKTTILFIGYQAENSTGRKILEGEREIVLEDKVYKVKAEILSLLSYSAHLDKSGIIDWLNPQRLNLKTIFLTHGDKQAKESLKIEIMDKLAVNTIIPKGGEVYEI